MREILDIMTIYDFIIIILVILLSVFVIFFSFWQNSHQETGDDYIVITSKGETIKEIPIEKTYDKLIKVEVKGPVGLSIIEAHQGKVRMKRSSCSEKICEKTGWINEAGPSIICVPNKISIWIESKDTKVDGVSW